LIGFTTHDEYLTRVKTGICCAALNTGLYAAMKEMNDIKALWVGHDHKNDFYGDFYGITLGYGRKTGYGGYGPAIGK
jgi:3',5'-cyclic AMP phosphodiesterase CpdA